MIKMYTTTGCGDCIRTKAFFTEKNIEYQEIDIEKDKNAMEEVKKTNKGFASVPTIFFEDGSILTEPSNQELSEKLGI